MNPRLKVCVALSALALSAMLPAAAERGAEGFLDRAKSVLREEARSFHEDVTSSNRWREWALHRANGEETDVQGWLSSRWEETPVRLADGYAASLADWAAADLRESDWVETLDFSFQLPIEGRSGRLNVSAIGPLARGLGGGDGVLGWQFPLAAGSADDGNTELSGNVGLFYRQVLGGSGLAGLNVFGDYQDEGADGSFWRWSLGAEYRTAWADVYANRYFPSAVSHRQLVSGGEAERIAYSAGGYDAEVRVHAPGSDWLEGFAEYSLWEGEHGDGDEEGFRYGFRFSPRTGGVADGLRLEADYDAAGGGLGGRFDYSWTVGEFRRIGGVSAFDPRSHLLSPVERRHAQRVRVRTRDLSWSPAPAVGRSASGGGGDYSCDLSETPPGGKLTESSAGWDALNRGLSEAASRNDYQVVCEKLQAGADPDYPGLQVSGNVDRALHYAASSRDDAVEIVTLLISAGAHVDAPGADNETALHSAADSGSFHVAAYLLKEGAVVNKKSPDASINRTPLDIAARNGDRRMAELLRSYGGKCGQLSADDNNYDWCSGGGLTAPLNWIEGVMFFYAAAGYQGSLPTVSAAGSDGQGVSVRYGLSEASEDFVYDATLRVLSTAPGVSMETGRLYSVTLWAEGRHDSLQPLTLYATAAVSLLSDVSRTLTASPYADYSSGGGLVTLSSLWEGLPGALSYEKAGGAEELAVRGEGRFLRWSGSAATLGGRYQMSGRASAPWLAGSLSFSAEVEAGCAAGGEYGKVSPDTVSDDDYIFRTAGLSKFNDACWLIGHKGSSIVHRNEQNYGVEYFDGTTPLHWAAGSVAYPQGKMVALLLFYGADPLAQAGDGGTPLDWARGIGTRGITANARPLREAGGLCYVEDHQGCGLRFLPRSARSFSATVSHGLSGGLWTVTVGVASEASEVSYRLVSEDSRLSVSGWTIGAEQGFVVSSETPLSAGESLSASVALWAGLQTLSASLAVTAAPCAPGALPTAAEAADLIDAVNRGIEIDGVCRMILAGADVNAQNSDGSTPLHRAVVRNYYAAVSLLIAAGAKVDLRNNEGKTPLYKAASLGRTKMVSLLLSAGANGGLPDNGGITPLDKAVENGLDVAADIRDALPCAPDAPGALPTAAEAADLIDAVNRGIEIDGVCRMILAGADVNAQNSDGSTPLHRAVVRNYYAAVSLLVDVGAEVDLRNNGGKTPLYKAASLGRAKMVSLLLSAGANGGLADNEGITPLDKAVENGLDVAADIRDALPCAPDAPGAPPTAAEAADLIEAVNRGIEIDGVCRMILAGADVNAQNSDGATPLHRAVVGDYYAAVSLLIGAGAEVDAQNLKGKTPLYLAASLERAGMVSLLLSAGANGGLPDNDGITPLDKAVENDLDVVADIRDAGGVCLTRTDAACGLIMRPRHSTVVVAENHVGAALAVTATTHGDASPVYSLVHDVNGFSVSGAGELTADSGTLVEGLIATVSIQAATEGGTQSVAVERVVSVSAPTLAGVLSDYPSHLTAAAGYAGALATLSATEEGVTVSYASGLDKDVFTLAALPSGKAALSLVSGLGAEGAVAMVAAKLGKHGHAPATVTALVTVAALGPFDSVEEEIEADHLGTIHQFTLSGYESALFSAAEGSAMEFDVSPNGEVLRNVILDGETVYEVVAEAADEGFLGAVSLTLNVSVRRKEARAEFSAARYRAAVAGGYEGAVLTLSAADERVSLSYLEGEEDGLNGSSFSLVSLSSGDYALSLETALSGSDIAVLGPSFEFHRTGFLSTTLTADIRVTILGPYSDSAVIQHNAASVAYRFVVPGFAEATFEEVEGSGSNDGFYSVSSADGAISWSLSLTASVSHTIVVRGRDDGFLGDALFTLALSVSFCKADMERASEDDAATLDGSLIQAAGDGDVSRVCELLQQGATVGARDSSYGGGSYGHTPLHVAAWYGHLNVVKYLLSRDDVDANARDWLDYTPLHLAAQSGYLDIVKYLSSHDDVDVNAHGNGGETPLDSAVYNGHLDVVKYLSSRDDIDANARIRALHLAAGYGYLDIAAGYGYLDMVKYLSSRDDVDVNARDDSGKTPLDLANTLKMAALLRARGGVCLIQTYEQCGLVMRPLHSTVVVGANHAGAALAVTATTHGGAAPVYSLVDDVDGFSLNSRTGELTADSGTLAEGLAVTVSIQAAVAGGAQSVTVERVVKVLPLVMAGLSDYPSHLTAAAGYAGALATLSATEEGVTVSYDSGLDEEMFMLAALPSGKAALSLVSPLGAEGAVAMVAAKLGKHGHAPAMVTALVTVTALALGPFDSVEKKIGADHLGTIHQFTLSGYESASFSAAEGSSQDFEVSSNGAVSRKEHVILEGETRYEVVVQAEDGEFLGAVLLTLDVSVSVRGKESVNAEFSAARYRVAMAGGYEGAVLTLSAADEGVSFSYLDGLGEKSPFSLVSLSSGDYAVSLETAVSGPDVAVLEPRFVFHKTGLYPAVGTEDIRVTILGPYSHSAVIQRNATSVAYRFVVPGFAGATFEEVEGSGSNDGFYSVSSADGAISWSLSLTASVSHTIVVRGRDDGFVGDALFTLALSVSFCKADVERASEDDVAALNGKLLQAAEDGDAGLVCELLQQGADVGARDRSGDTPLHWAAWHGHLEVVKYLLSRGDVDANARDRWGNTPLHNAALKGHLEVVKYLLSRGDVDANVFRFSSYVGTPLDLAARYGHLEVVKYLLSRGDFDADALNEALHDAAGGGHLDMVKYLLSRYDVDADALNKGLNSAAGGGHLDMVKYLLSRDDVDAAARDINGRTPLHNAA